MSWHMHTDGDGYIDGIMPTLLDDGRPNVNDEDLALGWEPWPFDGDPPEDFSEWRVEGGALAHDPRPPTEEELHAQAVAQSIDELPEAMEGLVEVAEMAASNEATLEEVIDAVMELAALIGGE